MRYLSIKNFEQYQHYKDRRPPWIKLHVSILDDYEFGQLSDASKAHLMLLWVLASKHENKIPFDLVWLTNQIAATDPIDLEELILRGFLEPHDEKRAAGKREGWASRYVSAQTRSALLSASQHTCSACAGTEKLEIDHITPISKGGTSDPANLQVLCRQCNRRKRALLAEQGAGLVRSKSLHRQKKSAQPETETETETEKRQREKKLLPGSGEPEPTGKSKYPHFPTPDSDRFYQTCITSGFAVEYSLLRKVIAPFYPQSGPVYPAEQVDNALRAFIEARGAQHPDKARFWTPLKFAEDLARWVRLGAMPRSDVNGVTERGRLAVGL